MHMILIICSEPDQYRSNSSLQLLKPLKCGPNWKSNQSPLLFRPKVGDMLLHSLKIPTKLKS